MLIIGIDPSVSNTGIALLDFDEDKQTITVLDFHNIIQQSENIDRALYNLELKLYKYCFEWISDCGAEYILYEYSNFFSRSSNSLVNSKLQGVYHLIGKICYQLQVQTGKIQYQKILSNSAKAVLFPKEKIKKDKSEVKEKKEKRKPIGKIDIKKLIDKLIARNIIILSENIEDKRRDDNINDALAIAIAGAKKYNVVNINIDN